MSPYEFIVTNCGDASSPLRSQNISQEFYTVLYFKKV